MSFEVALLKDILKKFANKLGEEADIEIIETHHNKKIDSPSGTALLLAKDINKAATTTLLALSKTLGCKIEDLLEIL